MLRILKNFSLQRVNFFKHDAVFTSQNRACASLSRHKTRPSAWAPMAGSTRRSVSCRDQSRVDRAHGHAKVRKGDASRVRTGTEW